MNSQLPVIRAYLADLVFFLPSVTVETPNGDVTLALAQSLRYQPEMPPEVVPCAWLGDSTGEIVPGSLEIWTHHVPLSVAVHEAGSAEIERASIEAFLGALVAHLRGATAIPDVDAFVGVASYEQGQIQFQNKTYRGFTLTLDITEKLEAAADYVLGAQRSIA